MGFVRRQWYNLGLPVAALGVLWAVLGSLSTIQVILLLNFVVLLLHQFEEYGWPGGEPWIINEAMLAQGGPADRYPLNQNNAFFINVVLAYPFYLAPVFLPNTVWLGLAPTLFGFAQFGMHGIGTNRKLRVLYNPGLTAVVLGHIPLGIWYLIALYSTSAVSPWNWVFGVAYMAAFAGIGMKAIGYGLLGNKDSPYPFAPEEMERFDRRGRLARLSDAAA
ncbi:MAG TPA: HXXEE domain-containing protein [Gemmatimonadaceae bacterium]|nr:HXXEE domain-containing protein [Gemmatimonadaceae bacterium]